jgi:hypothetical protein
MGVLSRRAVARPLRWGSFLFCDFMRFLMAILLNTAVSQAVKGGRLYRSGSDYNEMRQFPLPAQKSYATLSSAQSDSLSVVSTRLSRRFFETESLRAWLKRHEPSCSRHNCPTTTRGRRTQVNRITQEN